MKVVTKKPSKKIIIDGYRQFCFNGGRILLTVLLFPIIIFGSKKYMRDFFNFHPKLLTNWDTNNEFKKFGFYNSFEAYHQNLIAKELKQLNFCFNTIEETQMKTVMILNQQQEFISALYLQHPHSQK